MTHIDSSHLGKPETQFSVSTIKTLKNTFYNNTLKDICIGLSMIGLLF